MSAYSNTVKDYLEKYLENAAYNLFELEDISVSQEDAFGNQHVSEISPLFLSNVVDIKQNQELLNIIMEEVPLYYIEPTYTSDSELRYLTPTRDIGQNDVPSVLQSEFWEVWFRHSFGDIHNNLLLDVFNKLKYPFVNENQYLSAMLFSELADKAYYSSSDYSEENRLSFQDKNTENIEYLNNIMDTKLASIYSMLNYSPNQSELISYWTESLYESGQMSLEDISKESEVFKLQDLKHELYRRKFAGSVTLYNLALKSVNLQGTVSGTLQVSAFGILQKQFNDTRLIRLLSAYELISSTQMTLEFSPIKEFYNKQLGTNNSSIPLGILEPLYYTSSPSRINGYKQEYSAKQFYFEPTGLEDEIFEGSIPSRDEYQKGLLRNQNNALNWITPERVLSNIDQSFFLTLDTKSEDDTSEIKLKLDKGVQLTDRYLELITLDVAAKPIPLTAYTNTAIDISVSKFYYYRNVLQEEQADSYPFLTSRIAKGNSVTLIDSKWMNYIQAITAAKSKVGDIPAYGAQVSKFYPYTDIIFRERPFFYLTPYKEDIGEGKEPNRYADLYYVLVKTNQNERETGSYGLVELLSRSHVARILLPREREEDDAFDSSYSSERDVAYTYARGILPFTYTANDLIDPGKTIYNTFSLAEDDNLEFHDNILDRGYTPVIYIFSNNTLCISDSEIEVPTDENGEPFRFLKNTLEEMGYTLTPQEDTVFVQYLVRFGNTFRMSEPIYVLNGMFDGNYEVIRPKLSELLDTGKLMWAKFQENYRSEYTSVSMDSSEAAKIYTELTQSEPYVLPPSQKILEDTQDLLLWINPYLNYTPKSASPLRHRTHSTALPATGTYNNLDNFKTWDKNIFGNKPTPVEEPKKSKTITPSESSALQNLSFQGYQLDKAYYTVNTRTGKITRLTVPTEETDLVTKQARLTINTISGDTSGYDYNHLYRYFSGYSDKGQDPVMVYKDERSIPTLNFAPSFYRNSALDDPDSTSRPESFSLVSYDILSSSNTELKNPIFCMNIRPAFSMSSTTEEQCLLTIRDEYILCVCKTQNGETDNVEKTVEFRHKTGAHTQETLISVPMTGEEARVTLAYSSTSGNVSLIVNNCLDQVTVSAGLPAINVVKGRLNVKRLNVKLFFNSIDTNKYAFPYTGNVYDIRLYNRTAQLFDLFALHMGTFRELYSYAPFNNIMGYNIYKDIGITRILYRNYPTEKIFPSITHFRVFTRSVWDSILLDLGFEKEDFQLKDDVDIIDPTDPNNTYAISQQLIEKVETLSNQSASREEALDVISTLGRYPIRNRDVYSVASLMLYPVKYDDAEFTFNANKIEVHLNSDLTTLTLSKLAIPVSGDTSTLKLSTTLAPNFLAKNDFKFTSAESTGTNILSQYYDAKTGLAMVKRVGENNSVRDVSLNYLSVPIHVPANQTGYLSGIKLGKTQLASNLTALLRATAYYDELQIPGVLAGVPNIEYTKYSALRFLREGSYFITCSYPIQIRPYNRSTLPESQEYPILYGKTQFKIEVSSEDHELDESAKKHQDILPATIQGLESFSINPEDNRTFPHKDINIRLYAVDNPLLIGNSSPIYKLLASNVPTDIFDYVETSDTKAVAGTTYYTLSDVSYVEAPFKAGETYHKDSTGNMVLDAADATVTSDIHYRKVPGSYVKANVSTGSNIESLTLYVQQPKMNGVIHLTKSRLDAGLYVEGIKLFLGENYKAPFWTAADTVEAAPLSDEVAIGSGSFKKYVIGPENLPEFVIDASRSYTLLFDYDAYISEFSFVDNPSIADKDLRQALMQAVNHIQNPDRYFYSGAPIAIEDNATVRSTGSGFKFTGSAGEVRGWKYKGASDTIQYFGNPNARSSDKNFLTQSGKNLSVTALRQSMDAYSYPLASDNVNALYLQSVKCYTNGTKTACAPVTINEKSLLSTIRDARARSIKSQIANFSASNLLGLLVSLSSFSLMLTDNVFNEISDIIKPEISDKEYSYFKYLNNITPIPLRNSVSVRSDTFFQSNLFNNTDFSNITYWANKSLSDTNWTTSTLAALSRYVSDPWIDGLGKMVYAMQGASQYRLEYLSAGIAYTDTFEIAISAKTPDSETLEVKALCYENNQLKDTVTLSTKTYNPNGWIVYSASKALTSVNTITFEFKRASKGTIYVSKPVARVRNHISGIRGFSNVERTERTTNDTTTFSIPYPDTIVLKHNVSQQLVPISFDPKIISNSSSVQVLSGAQVMADVIDHVSTIGKPENTQYLVSIVSPWERMISLSNYNSSTRTFESCHSYKLYTEESNNTELKKTIDASIYNMANSKFEYNEVASGWSGTIALTSNNMFKTQPCNLEVRRDNRSLRLKDSSFSLLTNCFNPRAILRGEDSEVCITNIQAYNLSEDLQEMRILEMEYPPLIYNELNQHISINLLLNRMNSYAPVLAGEVNKELYNSKLPQPVVQVSPGITSDYGILTISNALVYKKFGAVVVSVKTEDGVLCTENPESLSVRIDDNNLIYAQAMVEDFEPSPEYEEGLNPHLKTQEPVEACYTVEGKMMVSLECDTPGSIIYYTVSSNKTLPAEPTLSSTLYTEPFEYNGETIKAKAFKPGYLEPSNTVVIGEKLLGFKSNDTKLAGYNGNVVGYNSISVEQPQRLPTPVLNCTYPTLSTGHITVANASDYTDAPVYVTLYADGEKIATALASELSVDIMENRSYTARAFSTGRWGSYRSEALVPNLKVPTPTIMIHTEDDIEAWTVSMACSLADSEIHYTMTENATPNSDSPVYSSPLPYRGETVKAIATKDQVQDSDIATAGSAILSTKDGILGYDGDPVGYDVLN